MSEGAVVVVAAKKRVRKPKVADDPRPLNINGRFVCAYTGMSVAKALVFKALPGLAFANMPCAFSYARAHAKGEKVLRAMAEEYNQSYESVPFAPDPADLGIHGGKLTYDLWISSCAQWDVLTESAGLTVAGWDAAHPKAQTKKAKKPDHIELEAGCYLISPKGTFTRCSVDEPKKDDEGVPQKGGKTVASAWRTVCKGGKQENGQSLLEHFVVNDHLFVGTTKQADEPINETASNMACIPLTGSVLFITGRKIKVAK